MAPTVYKVALAILAVVVTGAVVRDVILWLMGRPTISDWLRSEPAWFVAPASVIIGGLAALAVHLYLLPSVIEFMRGR